MSQLNALAAALALANQAAEVATVDMSEVSQGGGERRILPAGFAFARLVEYIELGEHITEFKGKKKPAAMQFRLGFALWGDTNPQAGTPDTERPDDCFHYYDNEGVKRPTIYRTYDMSLGNNEKATVKLAFDKMNWQNKPGVKSFGQFLGQGFLVPITRTKVKEGKNAGKERNGINWANLMKPFDPVGGTPYPIPECPEELVKYFFWDMPTPESWEALKIGDGSLNEKGESKDFIRDFMKKAVNFEGSALHIMLGGAASAVTSLPVPDLAATAQAQQPPAVPQVTANTPQVSAPAVPNLPADVPFDGGTIPAVPTVQTLPAVPALPVV